MSYTKSLSSSNPGCFIFLLDQSSSMDDRWENTSKKDKVADIINNFLLEMVLTCTQGESVKDRSYVSVIGYGAKVGSAYLGNLAGKFNVKISEIDNNVSRLESRMVKQEDGAGGIIESKVEFPIWIDAVANGSTPMLEAFDMAKDIVSSWVKEHPDSYPPIVVNITDGEYNESPEKVVKEIRSLATSDGNTLIFNVHIGNGTNSTFCPNTDANLLNSYSKELFSFSSELPESMIAAASERGSSLASGSRGFVFNVDPVGLISFLTFASPLR